MDLKGKGAIVTGGASGIGLAIVECLLDRGCKVCVADVNETLGTQVEQDLSKGGKHAIFVKTDVSSQESFQGTFEKTLKAFGSVDILINNAGILREEEYEKTVLINLLGPVHGTELAKRYMSIKNGGKGGIIVNTASNAAISAVETVPVYTATKFGIVGLTRAFGSPKRLAEHGIRMCTVCPGSVDTPMFRRVIEELPELQDIPEIKRNTENVMKPSFVAKAYLKVIDDGKNGAILKVFSVAEGYQYEFEGQ